MPRFDRRSVARVPLALVTLALAACGGQRIADRCEVRHLLRSDDEITARITKITDGWSVSFRMSVRLNPAEAPLEVRGLARVWKSGSSIDCQVLEAGGPPGTPRFDRSVCLDELESVAEILADAEEAARPGETVVQEVRLRVRRRRRARSSVGTYGMSFRETAEITRDVKGRVVHLVRSNDQNAREEVVVEYPRDVEGRCLPAPED